jgi:antitoxin MazE
VKTKLVRIGNSRGVRLPKPLIEEAGLPDEVELEVRKGAIVISPAHGVRSGWEDAAKALHDSGDDQLLDANVNTRFDEEEWTW